MILSLPNKNILPNNENSDYTSTTAVAREASTQEGKQQIASIVGLPFKDKSNKSKNHDRMGIED